MIQILLMLITVVHINGCIIFMVPMLMDFPEDDGNFKGPCWVVLRGYKYAEPQIQYSWSIFKVPPFFKYLTLFHCRQLHTCFALVMAKHLLSALSI